ncbi:POK6 protein, partial [Melanocharis versteri]|nr:POK6 protein [Melanocharis versteri]
IQHTTGIPHSLTGQSVVERTHQNIKKMLSRQKGGDEVSSPAERLSKALFTLNFLNCSFEEPLPPVTRHFANSKRSKFREQPPVLIRDPESQKIDGPFP